MKSSTFFNCVLQEKQKFEIKVLKFLIIKRSKKYRRKLINNKIEVVYSLINKYSQIYKKLTNI